MARKSTKEEVKAPVAEQETPEVEVTEEVSEEVEEKKEEVKETPEKSQAIVKRGRNTVRVYTVEKHGKDFKKLAEEYISSREGLEVEVI